MRHKPGGPVNDLAREVKNFVDSPSLGLLCLARKPLMALSPCPGCFSAAKEQQFEAGLPAEIVTEGGAPLAVVRGWEPTGGMPWEDFASRFGTPESRN